MTPDWKRPKPYRATKAEWEHIRRMWRNERCRVCRDRAATECHHLVPRSQRGDDVVVNLLPVCRDCHRLVTENKPGALAAVRRALTEGNRNYFAYKFGGDRWEAWLERRYPLKAAA